MKGKHLKSVAFALQFASTAGFTLLPLSRKLGVPSWAPMMDVTVHHSYLNNNGRTKRGELHASPFDVVSTFYTQALMSNPLETKLATGGILALAGDAIAQSRVEDDYDVKRAGAFISFDIFYRAVQCALFPEIIRVCDGHYLASLTSVLPGMEVNQDVLATLEQTMFNQFLVIPFIYYPVFFTLTGYVQGLSLDATIERVSTTIVPLLKRNWAFWIPVQYFQFGYVDEPLQIPFLCLVGLAWTCILSIAAGSVKSYDAESVEEEVVVISNLSYNNGELTLEEKQEEIMLVGQNATISVLK